MLNRQDHSVRFEAPESHQSQVKVAAVFSAALLLSACGSGSSQNDAASGADDTPINTALSGTVVMEERNGKTIFDGWFTQGGLELGAAHGPQIIETDSCVASSIGAEVNGTVPSTNLSEQNVDSLWKTGLKSTGDAINIDSRVGEFESLSKQQLGNTTVYAPENRWQSDSQPEDAVLSFDSGSIFGNLHAIDVPPLMPLVWVAPETGVLTGAASALRWEASFNNETLIRLRLSTIDFSDSDNPEVITIACQLVDDGLFTLPADFQEKLPSEHSGIAVYAVRERVQQILSDDSQLTVVQLSHPTPAQ